MKNLISWLQAKYAILCPHCGMELNWFETAYGKENDTVHLKCVTCDIFFIHDEALTETDVPGRRIEHFKQQGWDDEGYQGGPSSHYYKPKWLRRIERLLNIE
ncbi:hypothetical protein [Paenibacillus sp. LHD-38]|uniref:hypothetical protein n=1 Tax=Paenibacillus sp. LHD-38 TaxID=3072143 RepID=UPI0028107FF6|nr:hypothetical protein [Paenibacillus sp. LHD-38]MDQ8735111.1 hypothetical protein [Paenibacillus sp. LHD-38]